MFDQLFQNPRALARQRTGPLAEERRRYLVHCAEQQMSRRTLRSIARYTLIAAQALRLAERPSAVITRAEVAVEVEHWTDRRSRRSTARQVRLLRVDFTSQVIRWLTFLGRWEPAAKVPQPYADQIAQFLDGVRERDLSPQTIANYSRVIRPFLTQLEETGLRLKTLTVAQLDELVIKKFRDEGYARSTMQTRASVFRLFTQFAEERGWCRQGVQSLHSGEIKQLSHRIGVK